MKKRNILLLGIVCAVVIIQFIRPERNNSVQEQAESMVAIYHPPDSIRLIIQQSCSDCHSNNTRYPWYAAVQPVRWFLEYHIRNGKKELNLDEFAAYSRKRRIHKLKAIKNQITDGDMPLPSYLWMHKEARLSKNQKEQLTTWIDKLVDSLKSTE